ncbi:MAG: hypothetical protein WCF85_16370 [Rhodospirillaceae bacterium]
MPRRPGRGGGTYLSPIEIEARINRDLRFIPARSDRIGYLVMDLATPGRQAQGRRGRAVLMFVLVRQVTLTKRLDFARVAARVAADYPDLTISYIKAET